MLKSIDVKNFKKIGHKEITLGDFSNINYMVGINGSGKSSVLQGIFRLISLGFNNLEKDNLEIFSNSSKIIQTCFQNLKNTTNINGLFEDGKQIYIGKFSNKSAEIKNEQNQSGYYLSFDKIPNEKKHLCIWSAGDDKGIMYLKNGLIVPKILDGYFNYEIIHNISNNSGLMEINIIDNNKKSFNGNLFVSGTNSTKGISDISVNDLASGYKNFQIIFGNISSEIDNRKNDYDQIIVLIDEPENHLHPELQKKIPLIIQDITEYYKNCENINIQFFVCTHSPFVISTAAEIVENELNEQLLANGLSKKEFRKSFVPTQKVYHIENGECANPKGSRGQNMIFESAKMLGAGMDSIIIAPKSITNNDGFIVFCESNLGNDSKIYEQIFKDIPCVFISCDSCGDVYRQYITSKEFYKFQKGQIGIIGVIDNDEQNSKIKEWQKEGIKVLERPEIENYLYDINVVKNLSGINTKAIEELESVDINTIDCKSLKVVNQQLKDKHIELAKIIYARETQEIVNIYNKLYENIFTV